jgi:Fuc2NAc and GlcNAc transferase
MIYLYNFMDGIDGIASAEAISVSLGVIILCPVMAVSSQIVLALTLLICAVVEFMVSNFQKAKKFLGDVGNGYLGVIFALLTLNAGWVYPACVVGGKAGCRARSKLR